MSLFSLSKCSCSRRPDMSSRFRPQTSITYNRMFCFLSLSLFLDCCRIAGSTQSGRGDDARRSSSRSDPRVDAMWTMRASASR